MSGAGSVGFTRPLHKFNADNERRLAGVAPDAVELTATLLPSIIRSGSPLEAGVH